jgi:hypothetical protein
MQVGKFQRLGRCVVSAVGYSALSIVFPVAAGIAALAVAAEDPIEYSVVEPYGYSNGRYDAQSIYRRMQSGQWFDNEPMLEVPYQDYPKELPPPTIVAPGNRPIPQHFKAGRVASKSDLVGEDAVFQRIYDDEEIKRCAMNPEECEKEYQEASRQRQFIQP